MMPLVELPLAIFEGVGDFRPLGVAAPAWR